ncbi:DUF6153 family protein [Streptomyces sp. ISL-94]|uniref:DUF6153 family protein n=1 Tax=Streptomyces sp. ISL-94 TaxID=2819190 RepID=UPI0020356B25|nr:DUF6153 family protein [Streptomyces sp. ISL-94]
MSRQARRAVVPFGLCSGLLLVLTVLFGLVAMHGLGPGGLPAAAHTTAGAHHGAEAAAVHDGCVHADDPSDGGSGGGHAEHADATCAAAGVAGSPVLPVPAVLPGTVHGLTGAGHGVVPDVAFGGRAPPSLSELQLLRI